MSTENTKLPADQTPSPGAPESDDEFDAAMAEATADEDAPAPAAADPWTDGPADGTDEPPAPASAAAQASPAADNAPSENPDDSDLWANAPAELREAFEQTKRDAELRLKSVQGRQSAADRELQRLRAELEEAKRAAQAGAATGGAANDQGQDGNDDGDDPYRQLVEDYPEIAGPLVENLKQVQAELRTLRQGVGTFEQERQLAYYKQQQDLLTEQQPDWMETLRDDRFGGWLQEQPKPVQEAFERNRQVIVDGTEAAWLVGQFKAALGINRGQQAPQANRRAKQLASGRDFSGGAGGPVTEGIPDDFDAAMNVFAEMEDAQARRR